MDVDDEEENSEMTCDVDVDALRKFYLHLEQYDAKFGTTFLTDSWNNFVGLIKRMDESFLKWMRKKTYRKAGYNNSMMDKRVGQRLVIIFLYHPFLHDIDHYDQVHSVTLEQVMDYRTYCCASAKT